MRAGNLHPDAYQDVKNATMSLGYCQASGGDWPKVEKEMIVGP